MPNKHQGLRVPEGFVIMYNTFFDVEPPIGNFKSSDWWYFKESLLYICYMKSDPKILLDLGWYPEFDPEGKFAIQVFKEDFSGEQLVDFESRSKKEIVDKINEILKDIAEGRIGKIN